MITDTSTAEQTGGLQQTARDLASEVGQTAERQADTAMTQAGSTVREVASALRSASGDLTQQQPQLGRVGEMAASRMEDVASYLDAHEPREVLDEAERIARQQPALVIAGGLALGLVLGRLLRTATSSTMNGSGRSNGDWYGQGLCGSGGTGIRSSSGAPRTAVVPRMPMAPATTALTPPPTTRPAGPSPTRATPRRPACSHEPAPRTVPG